MVQGGPKQKPAKPDIGSPGPQHLMFPRGFMRFDFEDQIITKLKETKEGDGLRKTNGEPNTITNVIIRYIGYMFTKV